MAYVLETRVVFGTQAEADDAYEQIRARTVNALVGRVVQEGLEASSGIFFEETDRSPNVIKQWHIDRFGIIRDGRPDTDYPPMWIQPIGSVDAYPLNDLFGIPARVTHARKWWQNNTAANVWEPGAFGWDEVPPGTGT